MHRLASVALVLTLASFRGVVVLATGAAALPVTVHVVNRAGASDEALAYAQRESARIYGDVGVTVRWVDCDGLAGGQLADLTVFVVQLTAMKGALSGDALGGAPGTRDRRGRVAYVFFDRIDRFVRTLGGDTSQLLAFVMAHEMGHLLLPYDAHTNRGIMRRGWSIRELLPAYVSEQRFTPAQGELIRDRIMALRGMDRLAVNAKPDAEAEP